ncbi:MAG TPA: extradiol dioxygenase [Blastocatellia bacterium]|nr:extradiol dioxygenase [Blastocatellia bacterium]
MIVGAHSIIYSSDADADRAFLRDVLKLPHVDVGEGWLIFGLPPAEVAMHPSDENNVHEFYLMCDNVSRFIAEMQKHSIVCSPAQNLSWGVLTQVTLPGGGKLGVYQPLHARPKTISATKKSTKRAVSKRPKKAPATSLKKRPVKSTKKRKAGRR